MRMSHDLSLHRRTAALVVVTLHEKQAGVAVSVVIIKNEGAIVNSSSRSVSIAVLILVVVIVVGG